MEIHFNIFQSDIISITGWCFIQHLRSFPMSRLETDPSIAVKKVSADLSTSSVLMNAFRFKHCFNQKNTWESKGVRSEEYEGWRRTVYTSFVFFWFVTLKKDIFVLASATFSWFSDEFTRSNSRSWYKSFVSVAYSEPITTFSNIWRAKHYLGAIDVWGWQWAPVIQKTFPNAE